MLARSLLRCAAPRRTVSRQWQRAAKGRRYSTASSGTSGGGVPSTAGQAAPMLATFTEELDKIAPRFDIRGDQVKVLRTPSEFYETLKVCGLELLNGDGLVLTVLGRIKYERRRSIYFFRHCI